MDYEALAALMPIRAWDWPNKRRDIEGYEVVEKPDVTPENIAFMAERFNELLAILQENNPD